MPAEVRGRPMPSWLSCTDRAAGDSGLTELHSRQAKPRPKDASHAAADLAEIEDRVRVYFPSQDSVLHSRGGENVSAAPTAFLLSLAKRCSYLAFLWHCDRLQAPSVFRPDGGSPRDFLARSCETASRIDPDC